MGRKGRSWAIELVIVAAPLALLAALPIARASLPLSTYVPLHSLAEVFAVVVAALVFASGWSARERGGQEAVVGVGFLAVSLFDALHMLSYASMPALVTPSGPAKAIYFWLAARMSAAITALSLPFALPTRLRRPRAWLAVTLVMTAAVTAAVLGAQDSLPEVFIAGHGLTGVKVGAEIVITALYGLAFVLLVRRGAPAWPATTPVLTRALLLMALGEIPFAIYRDVSDGFNYVGHVYKVLAYVFVYRAIFVESVRRPYRALERSLAALEESEGRFRQLAENVRGVFWLRDAATGRFLYISPGVQAVFGRAPDTVVDATSLMDMVHPDDRAKVQSFIDGSTRGETATFEYRIVRDGGERWVRATSFPVEGDGRVTRIAGITTDVTDERHAAELLTRAQRMEGLGRFAGGVAHDFNNLLTVIFASTEFALATLPKDHSAREDLEATLEAARQARELTTQLLSFARNRPSTARRIDLGEFVTRSCAMLRPLVGANVELSVLVDAGEHPVRVDPGHLDQVLLNLITNAKDATRDGGHIIASVDLVDGPRELSHAPCARLRVEDDGEGMPPEVAKHAFEPFFTTKQAHGTGLGLATSFGLIAQAGGIITIDSEVGAGTRMDVYLPLSKGPIDRQEPRRAARDLSGRETILLVDDEAVVRAFTARLLERAGYRVLQASNGHDALDVAAAHGGVIELLLTDVVMPLMGGAELARQLVAQRPQTRVLFISGYLGEEKHRLGHAILMKPYTGSTLLEAVREALDADREARDSA